MIRKIKTLSNIALARDEWFHGRPSSTFMMYPSLTFFTKSFRIAELYARNEVMLTWTSREGHKKMDGISTVFAIKLPLKKTFDVRHPKDLELYDQMREEHNKKANAINDTDDLWDKSTNPSWRHPATGLFSYSAATLLREDLVELGYDSIFVDDSTHGVTLGVFNQLIKFSVIEAIRV
jgi:hypothetical protein